jgi:dTDP-4-dehydrorhamnose reductase
LRPDSVPELWGGVECTVNRVENSYHEQLGRSGHDRRISDLDRFAELGIRALRQPVLWEQTAPNDLKDANWAFSDAWLGKLHGLRIRPIVGLVHHGSGPRHTSLLDPEFPAKLAVYARAVAERYPRVEDYTPVNEPLTTARFCGLYGHWYPHHRDDRSFLTALVIECKATILAMRAIREVNPRARLVQTDDLGKTFSGPTLQHQAEFENERRWLGWDLLCGRVNREHPLWGYLLYSGISSEQLDWFQDRPCPPDIIGVNHYLSSERFLDADLSPYPPETHGSNGRDVYADVLAARVRPEGPAGPLALLQEAWERYRIPIAVTEVHNGCTREEQLRWLHEVWNAAVQLRATGVDVRAVTLWSMLGAHDWDTLVTRKDDRYEPGVFDLRAPQPRPTALANLAKNLSSGHAPSHPLLETPGWWKRPQRFLYHEVPHSTESHTNVAPVLITGGRGTLARALQRACLIRGIPARVLVRSELDIADRRSVQRALEDLRPWAVLNAAGYVRVDDAELEPEACFRENSEGPTLLAEHCAQQGIALVTFSSDLVFDGAKGAPLLESDTPSPLNVYGKSKAEGEQRVLEIMPEALVIRTSAFFGPWDDYNFVTQCLKTIASRRRFCAAADYVVSPTYVPDLVNTTLDLLIDEECGIWHLANTGSASWAELAMITARKAGLWQDFIDAVTLEELALRAPRPSYSVLGSEKAWIMPSLGDALDRYIEASRKQWQAASEPTAFAA